MSSGTLQDVINSRSSVLEALIEGNQTKRDLTDTLPISRSTIDRAIEDLQCIDCIESKHSGYRATQTGRIAYLYHSRYIDNINSLQQATPVVNTLPADESIPFDLIFDSVVYTIDPCMPENVLEPVNDLFQSAISIRGIMPTLHRYQLDTLSCCITKRLSRVELVIEKSIFQTLNSHLDEEYGYLQKSDRVSLYVCDQSLTFGLWIIETEDGTTVAVSGYKNGSPNGTIVSDSTDAVTWAAETFQQHVESA